MIRSMLPLKASNMLHTKSTPGALGSVDCITGYAKLQSTGYIDARRERAVRCSAMRWRSPGLASLIADILC
jgi:hypothetical protein